MWRWVHSWWRIRDTLPGPKFYGAVVGIFLRLMVVHVIYPDRSVWSATILGPSHKANIDSFSPPCWLYFATVSFHMFILSPGIVSHLLPSFPRSPVQGEVYFPSALTYWDTSFKARWQTHQHCWKGLQQHVLSTKPWPFFACKRWGCSLVFQW